MKTYYSGLWLTLSDGFDGLICGELIYLLKYTIDMDFLEVLWGHQHWFLISESKGLSLVTQPRSH